MKNVVGFLILSFLLAGCKEEVMQSHNQKEPAPPVASPVPVAKEEPPPGPPTPSPPTPRHVDVVTCPERADAFRVEGEVAGEVHIEHTGSELSVEDLHEDEHVSFHVRIYAPGVTVISVLGSTSLRVLDLCGGQLRVSSAGSSDITISGRVEALSVDSAGSSTIELDGVQTRTLDVSAAGSTSIAARGDSRTIDISTAGSSSLDGFGMKAERVNVSSAGSSSIKVCVTGTLSVEMAGSDTVIYDCGPARVTRDISGAGSIRER